MLTRPILILCLLAVPVAGCGRRGDLERPAGPAAEAVSRPEPRPGAVPAGDEASPGATEPAEAAPGAGPERRFILDAII